MIRFLSHDDTIPAAVCCVLMLIPICLHLAFIHASSLPRRQHACHPCNRHKPRLEYIHTCLHTHTRTHIHTFTFIHTCTQTHTHTHTHTHIHTHLGQVSGGKAGEAPNNVDMNDDDDMHTVRYQGEFQQADADGNGKLSWEEWSKMLYHEEPQHPRCVGRSCTCCIPRHMHTVCLCEKRAYYMIRAL
jgi:hypothetical protein